MTEDKCLKCGTIIPKEAKFCPNCGAVKVIETPQTVQPQTVQPQPIQTQPVQPRPMPNPSRPMYETLGPLFSKNLIIVGILIGILIAWIGEIVARFTIYLSAGWVLNSLGFVFVGLFLTGGGIINKNLDKFVRLGLIVGGAITLGMGISI